MQTTGDLLEPKEHCCYINETVANQIYETLALRSYRILMPKSYLHWSYKTVGPREPSVGPAEHWCSSSETPNPLEHPECDILEQIEHDTNLTAKRFNTLGLHVFRPLMHCQCLFAENVSQNLE